MAIDFHFFFTDALITEVKPKYPEDTEIVENQENQIVLSIKITYIDNEDTTDIRGKGLWSMALFASDNPRGEGTQISLAKNAFIKKQKQLEDTDLIKGEVFKFDDVQYNLVMNDMRCDAVPFICATLGSGKRPKPGFGLEGDPDETALTGCTKAPKCIGKGEYFPFLHSKNALSVVINFFAFT